MSEKAKAKTATCPECGQLCKRPENLIKEWKATPKAKAGEIEVWIHYWQCPTCGNKFRTATRIWLKEEPEGMMQKLKKKLPLTAGRGST
jgi:endogenous inhibitor of DNA gyrase (YacG/DUF329 family)